MDQRSDLAQCRLALSVHSDLLAHRAGVALDSLDIDHSFELIINIASSSQKEDHRHTYCSLIIEAYCLVSIVAAAVADNVDHHEVRLQGIVLEFIHRNTHFAMMALAIDGISASSLALVKELLEFCLQFLV